MLQQKLRAPTESTMANEKEQKKLKEEEKEPKIPVFTVLKNGAILKNIFIVNKPPPPPHSNPKPISSVHQQPQEEILIVGRHPDCNIVLTHPSISRFHLQILSNPSSQNLSLTDLSSVHGTWISDRRIEAGVRVELREGDTLRVGSSSRVYNLHWIPLSRAYDFETPFMPLPKDDEEEDENADKLDQSDNSFPVENKENKSPDSSSEGIQSLFSDEILGLNGKKEVPSAPPMPENAIYSICDQSEEGGESSLKGIGKENDLWSFWAFGTESVNLFLNMEESDPNLKEKQRLQPHCLTEEVSEREKPESSFLIEREGEAYPAVQVPEDAENLTPLRKDNGKNDISCLSTSPRVVEEVLGETKDLLVVEENLAPEPKPNLLGNLNFEHSDEKEVEASPAAQVEENPAPEPKPNLLVSLNFEHSDEREVEASPAAQVPEESDIQSPLRKENGQIDISCLSSEPLAMENLSLSTGEILGEDKDEPLKEESLTIEPKPNFLINLNIEHSDEKEEEASPAALSSEPLVMENLLLPIREVLGGDNDELIEEESLTPELNSNVVNLNFEHSDEKEEEAYGYAQVPEAIDNQSPLRKDHGQADSSCLSSGPLVMEDFSLPVGEVLGETEDERVAEESLTPELKSNFLGNLTFEHSDEVGCVVDERLGETEDKSLSLEDQEKRDASICSAPVTAETINSSLPDGILSELVDDKENQTPQSLFTASGQPESEFCESTPLRSENKLSTRENIWARRGKPASAVMIQTDKSRGKSTEAGYDDDIEQEEEIFTPDKENFTPNTLQLRSLIKKGKIEVKHSKSGRSSSSKLSLVSNINQQDLIVTPEKEKQKLKELQERKSVGTTTGNQERVEKKLMATKVRRERMPFQSLENSGGKNRSEDSVPNRATRSSTSFSYTQTKEKVANSLSNKSVGEGKRGWTMVADSTTLLDKESRKSLQFLQGLKGTGLIIPRMVIRELDCLKQRGSLFRKKTEACLVLEWIEECMVKTNWWIHVQSSMEDARLIAPTPPVSPLSQFSEKSWGFPSGTASSLPFSRCRSFVELVSPAAEDHILDCALLHRKMKNDGQLVLLSNDITLKIKAMAEGLLCETAQEFHESLVNPVSGRFMWPNSSPRGRTWSCVPDVVLREKYSSYPLKKSSKGEGAKGLKLILLHNSHYGQIH